MQNEVGGNLKVVRLDVQPAESRLFAKPSELPLCQVAGSRFKFIDKCSVIFFGLIGLQIIECLPVSQLPVTLAGFAVALDLPSFALPLKNPLPTSFRTAH